MGTKIKMKREAGKAKHKTHGEPDQLRPEYTNRQVVMLARERKIPLSQAAMMF